MMIGVVTGICLLNSGHSLADLLDTGDPAEHLRQTEISFSGESLPGLCV